MSEAAAPREWRLYADDRVKCCDKVLAYTKGIDRQAFAADAMRYDATLRNLELIGEAATQVPAEIRATANDVPWRMLIALRNRLIHGYYLTRAGRLAIAAFERLTTFVIVPTMANA